jgi:hypothetical protein
MSFEPHLIAVDGRHIPVRWQPAAGGHITTEPLDIITEPVVITGAMTIHGPIEFPAATIQPGETYTVSLAGSGLTEMFMDGLLNDLYR